MDERWCDSKFRAAEAVRISGVDPRLTATVEADAWPILVIEWLLNPLYAMPIFMTYGIQGAAHGIGVARRDDPEQVSTLMNDLLYLSWMTTPAGMKAGARLLLDLPGTQVGALADMSHPDWRVEMGQMVAASLLGRRDERGFPNTSPAWYPDAPVWKEPSR